MYSELLFNIVVTHHSLKYELLKPYDIISHLLAEVVESVDTRS